MKLTEKRVRDAKPEGATRIIWDDEVAGFGLRVTVAGARSFVFDYRIGALRKRMTLGSVAELTLDDARAEAGRLRLAVRDGADPLAARRAAKALPTVNEALDRFVKVHMPDRVARGLLADTSEAEYTRQIDRHLRPAFGRLRVVDVAKTHIEKMLGKIKAPVSRNRVLALTRHFFNVCEGWELRPQHSNPTHKIEKLPETERKRTLKADALGALGAALNASKAKGAAILAIRLCALSGLRVSEVRNLRWENIDFETGKVILPRTKTGPREHTLPSAALALLADEPRIGPCVIPGRDPASPLDDRRIRRVFDEACKAAGLKDVRLHDLRRTVATRAAAGGASAHLLKELLGHKTLAMATRYVQLASEEVAELRERTGTEVAAAMAGKTGVVVQMGRRGG